jgi:hypothetical protein
MNNQPVIFANVESNGRVGTFFSRITRAHLIITAFIFLGLLSLSLLITVIVQAQNPRQNDNTNSNDNTNNNEFCVTEGCISAAAYQLRSIDSTASSNLCTDFYTYACGGWQQTHPIQSHEVERTILEDILYQRSAEIERLLDAPISRSDPNSWEYKIKVCSKNFSIKINIKSYLDILF